MENIKVIIEDIKNLRRKAKEMLETANGLEKSVFAIKQSVRKEKDTNKRREYQDATEDINLQIRGLRKDIENLEDSDIFRDKINIPKHTK